MSQSSYTPVRFVGGPKGGTTGEFAGEPKREWTPKRGGGTYVFEWDRADADDNDVQERLRSGVYTWREGEGAPTDGDAASALIEKVGPEKAAEKLNASGSSAVIAPAEDPQDGPADVSGDKSSAELGTEPSKDDSASKGDGANKAGSKASTDKASARSSK